MNNPYFKMDYSFKGLDNLNSYKINITDLNTDIIIIGKPITGAKINVYYDDLIIENNHDINRYLKVYNNKNNKTITIKNEKESSKTNPVKIILELPKIIDLNINNCLDSISIHNITGDIQIKNHLGIIDIESINGRLNIINAESKVNIRNSEIFSNIDTKSFDLILRNNSGDSNILTRGGSVFLSNHQGNLSLFTNGGSVILKKCRGDFFNLKTYGELIFIEDGKSDMNLSNNSGYITLKNINGAINAQTNEGNIDIKNHFGKLILNTNSGNLFLKDIFGSTDIKSKLGDIKIKINYESSFNDSYHSIHTLEGNIEMFVPKNLSISLTSQIGLNRSTQNITSDVPLKFSIEKNNIVGKANSRGGLIPIILFSKSGLISLREF